MENSKLDIFSAVSAFFKRVYGYDAVTRAAFICVVASLLNAVLCTILVFACAGYLLFSKHKLSILNKQNALGFIFGFLSLLISAVYFNYFGILASVYFLAVLVIMLSFKQKITAQKLEDAFTIMIFYSIIALIVAVIQRIFDLSAIESRSASTFLNALYYCYYISFVIMICLYRLLFKNANKPIYLSLIIINLFAMLITGSKMPFIGIAAAIFVMLLFAKRFKLLIAFTTFGIACLVALWVFKDYGITEKLNMNGFLDSYKMRLPYWSDAINGFLKKPVFGHGMLGILKHSVDTVFDTKGYIFNYFNLEHSLDNLKHIGWHLHAHNILFDCLYNYGIIGTLILFIAVLKSVGKMIINSEKNIFKPFITLTLCCFVFILVDGIVDCQIIGIQTLFISVFLFSITGIYDNKTIAKEF